MPDSAADAEYLRRQKARKQANIASGVSTMQMGGDAISGQEDEPSWLDFQSGSSGQVAQWGQQEQTRQIPRWIEQETPNFFPTPEEEGTEQDGSNWFLKMLGGIDELAASFGRGFVSAFEGIIDLGATGIAAIGEAMGNDMTDMRNFIATDYASRAAEWTKNYANYTPWGLVTAFKNIGNEQYRNNFLAGLLGGPVATAVQTFRGDDLGTDFYEYGQDNLSDMNIGDFKAGQLAGGIAESIGMMMASRLGGNAVAGMIGKGGKVASAANLAIMGAGAAGKGSEEAINEGATTGQALGYGAASGATEVATELVVGPVLKKLGVGTGAIMGMPAKNAAKEAVKSGGREFAKEFVKSMFEEGMEEVASGLMEPVNKSIYKGEDAFKDEQGRNVYTTPEFWIGGNESILGQFASGAITSGIMGGIGGEGKVYRQYGADGYKLLALQAREASIYDELQKEGNKAQWNGDRYAELLDKYIEAHNDTLREAKSISESGKLTETQLENVAKAMTDKNSINEFLKAVESENVRDALSSYLKSQVEVAERSNNPDAITREVQQRWLDQFNNEDVVFKLGTDADMRDPKTGQLARALADKGTGVVTVNPANLREFYQLAGHEGAGHVFLDSDPVVREKFVQSIEANPDLAKTFRQYDKGIVEQYSNSELNRSEIKTEGLSDEEISKRYNIPLETLVSERVAHFIEDFITNASRYSQIKALRSDSSLLSRLKNYLTSLKSWFRNRTDAKINRAFMSLLNEALDEIKSNKTEARRAEAKEASEKGGYTLKQTARAYAKEGTKKDSSGSELSDGQQEFFKDSKIIDENGNLERMYHGTSRSDRVGYYFDPNRATAGPMAYFTNDESIAEGYATNKADTSIEHPDSYQGWFVLKENGKPLYTLWNTLSKSEQNAMREKALQIRFDDEAEKIILDKNNRSGVGALDYKLRYEPNVIKALVDEWLTDGNLFGEEQRFAEVLDILGIKNKAEYIYGNGNENKVYKVFLNVTNPFDTSNISDKDVKGIEEAVNNQPKSEDTFWENGSYAWAKKNISPDHWLETFQKDISDGTSYAWTIIPDYVTDYLKSQGYDGIIDVGGKHGGKGHKVVIPFYSNQIKSIDNLNPSENPDIRFAKSGVKDADVVDVKEENKPSNIPHRYVKALGEITNDTVYAYQAVEDTLKAISKDIIEIANLDYEEVKGKAKITFDGQSRYNAVESLFNVLNKPNVSTEDIVKAIVDTFGQIEVKYDGKTHKVNLSENLTNEYAKKTLKAVEANMKSLVLEKGELSFKAKSEAELNALKEKSAERYENLKQRSEARYHALVEVYRAMREDLTKIASEMRERISPVRNLTKTIKSLPKTFKANLDVTINNDTLRLGSEIAKPILDAKWNGKTGYSTAPAVKGGTDMKTALGNVLEKYTAEQVNNNQSVFPYSNELRGQIQQLHDSIPDPQTKTVKFKDGHTEDRLFYATLNAEQTKLANSILKNIKGIYEHAVKAIRTEQAPLAITGAKAIEFSLAHPKTTWATSNAYINEFGSSWAVVESVLGGSALSDEMTINMNAAASDANLFEYQQREALANKVKELDLKHRLAVGYRFNGVKIQRGVLIDIYASLTSKTNFDSLNQNGMAYRDPKSQRIIDLFDKGEANSFLAKLNGELSDNEKTLAKWLKTDFYGGEDMRKHYKKTQTNRGITDIIELDDYYGLSAYNVASGDVEFMVRAPRSFGYDKQRVKHTHRFLASNAVSRAMAYVHQLAIEEYVRPQYKKVMGALDCRLEGGKTVREMLDSKYKAVYEHIKSMLGTYMGVDPSGKGGKLSSFASSFFRGYSTSLLALNPGTPFRQTISALYSMFGVKNVSKALLNTLVMSDAMKTEYNDLVKEMGELALRGKDGKVVFTETGAAYILEATRTAGEVLMKPIKWMDRATISLLTKGAMNLATNMGYEVGTKEHVSFSKDMIRVMLETQIGRLPTDVSAASAGYGKTGMLGRILTFMGGPARAALATMSNKLKVAQIVQEKGLTKEGVRKAVETAYVKVASWENMVAQAEQAFELGEEGAEETLKEYRQKLLEAKADELQAKNDERVYARYIAMGGKKWPVDAIILMLIAALFNAGINAFTKRVRGKEDWKWTQSDTETLLKDAGMYFGFGWLPAVNSVTNAVNGYDTSYPAGAMLSMFGNVIKDGISIFQGGDYKPLLRDGFEILSAFTGLPFKNAYSLVYGITKGVSKDAGEILHDAFYAHQDASVGDILKAVEANDSREAERLIGKLYRERVGTLSDPVQKEISLLYENGEQVAPGFIPSSYQNANGEKVVITWTDQQQAKAMYAKANLAVSKVVAQAYYKKLTYAQRARVLQSIYTAYRSGSLYSVIGSNYGDVTKAAMLVAKSNGSVAVANIISAAAIIRTLEATKTKSKKELAVELVNKLSLTRNEKLLVLFIAGYSVDTNAVKQALTQKGFTLKEAKEFVGETEGKK